MIEEIEKEQKAFERFMSRVEITPGGCWIARLSKCRKGYAVFSAFGKKTQSTQVLIPSI